MMQVMIFLIGTLGFSLVSYQSLRQPGTHGFYRYFAWELILLLFALNLHAWYQSLDGLHQTMASVLLLISLFLVLAGVIQLRLFGKPNPQRNDVPMVHFEKTTVLVKTGIYRYIRHPLYGSLFFLGWAFFFKDPSLVGSVIAAGASAFLMLAASREEVECIRFFGEPYCDYMKVSKRLVPFVW
ncbi:MAG: isoprenylcysteine carboxylmethyltransferase family protein [Methylophilaceae bacterium]